MIFRLILTLLLLPATLLAAPSVSPEELERAIERDRGQFAELAVVAQEAKARGLRVFLLGGGASSLAYFSKQRLLHEKAGEKITPTDGRFAYLYHSLLLPGQDLDLVITKQDGTPETAEDIEKFREFVRAQMPHENDGKSRWDVLGLKTADPGAHKLSLEGNADFLKQHNDGYSLAMVELTDPPLPGPVVKELGKKPEFLEDVAQGRLHFHFSPEHETTKFFKEGRNPPILAAVRALEKAYRYGAEIDDEGMDAIRKIVKDWDPAKVEAGSYIHNYLTGRGSRLVAYAQDPERAIGDLDALGLKAKLSALAGESAEQMGSLAWWLNKKSLPRVANGPAEGRTAAELKLDRVEHWTSLLGHRLINANYDGSPRIFASRDNVNGENAAHGEGFYTFRANSARGTGTSGQDRRLYFRVKPEAREGRDFTLVPDTDVVVWKNSAFLELEPSLPLYGFQLPCQGLYSNFAVRGTGTGGRRILGLPPGTLLSGGGITGALGVLGMGGLFLRGFGVDEENYARLFTMDWDERKRWLTERAAKDKFHETCFTRAALFTTSESEYCPSTENWNEDQRHAAQLIAEQQVFGYAEIPIAVRIGAQDMPVFDPVHARYVITDSYGPLQTRCLSAVFHSRAQIGHEGKNDWVDFCAKVKSPEQAALVESISNEVRLRTLVPEFGWFAPVLELAPEELRCVQKGFRAGYDNWDTIRAACRPPAAPIP